MDLADVEKDCYGLAAMTDYILDSVLHNEISKREFEQLLRESMSCTSLIKSPTLFELLMVWCGVVPCNTSEHNHCTAVLYGYDNFTRKKCVIIILLQNIIGNIIRIVFFYADVSLVLPYPSYRRQN